MELPLRLNRKYEKWQKKVGNPLIEWFWILFTNISLHGEIKAEKMVEIQMYYDYHDYYDQYDHYG
jgi:hypothetical protein